MQLVNQQYSCNYILGVTAICLLAAAQQRQELHGRRRHLLQIAHVHAEPMAPAEIAMVRFWDSAPIDRISPKFVQFDPARDITKLVKIFQPYSNSQPVLWPNNTLRMFLHQYGIKKLAHGH